MIDLFDAIVIKEKTCIFKKPSTMIFQKDIKIVEEKKNLMNDNELSF